MSKIEDEKEIYNDTHHVDTLEKNVAHDLGFPDKDHSQYLADAMAASESQKTQSISEAIKMYPQAMIWSIVFSAAIIMEGYDTLLLGQFYGQPAFTKKFGEWSEKGQKYEIPAKWQVAIGCAVQLSSIVGLQITGWASERLGYRRTMMIALVALTGFLFIPFFATSIQMILAAYCLLGFPWGTFQTMTVSYAAEVMPVALRPFLTTYVNLCWVIGQIIASGIGRALVDNKTDLAYKLPFALQWIWPVPILIGIIFAPESPWWLVRAGRFSDAENALMRLTSRKSTFNIEDARAQVAMMHHTNELEKEMKVGTTFLDCFKGTNLRRSEIACMVWMIQVICGSPLMGSATYFLTQAGLSPSAASTLNLIMFVIGGFGTMSSWFLMKPFGRRSLYLYGQVALSTLMLIVGVMGTIKQSAGTRYGMGGMLILFTGLYDLTVGPVCYSLVAEIGSTRLRAKTVVLARNFYNIGGFVVGFLNPYMLNTTAWNWGPKSAYLWLGTGVLGITWTYFRLPEPKGRTYGQLDILFEQRVPARQFSTTHVDEFEAAERDAAAAKMGGGGIVH